MCRSITGPVNSPAAQAVQMLASYQPVSVDHWAGEFAGWCHRYDQNIGYLECRSITGPVNSPARCRFRSRCSHKCRSITGPVNSPAANAIDLKHDALRCRSITGPVNSPAARTSEI